MDARHLFGASVQAGSKLKLQRQLDRARSADLIERIEAAAGAARSQTVRQRLRRTAEQGTGQVVDRIAEVCVVQDVEEFSPETKGRLLGEVKLPLQRNIRLRGPEPSQYVSCEIALLPWRRRRKSCSIEDFAAGISGAVEFKGR